MQDIAASAGCIDDVGAGVRFVYIGGREDGTGGGGKANPVNSLGATVRTSLLSSLRAAADDPDVRAIVLMGSGPSNFSAGADIREFARAPTDDDANVPSLVDICSFLQDCPKPVVAAIRGACLGGGLELALSCDFRVCLATPSTKLGLPETNIGLIPGAGGTQRLPRLTSVAFALDAIVSGRMVGPAEALRVGLVDATIDPRAVEGLEDAARRWASWAAVVGVDALNKTRRLQHRRVRTEADSSKSGSAALLCRGYEETLPPGERGGEARRAAVLAIRASFEQPTFEGGCRVEEELFTDLLVRSEQGRALRHAFFAERSAQRGSMDGGAGSSPTHPLATKKERGGAATTATTTIGVIGAGTMGRGIALSFLLAPPSKTTRFRVVLVDSNPAGLSNGLAFIRKLVLKDYVKKGRITTERAEHILSPESLASSTSIDAASLGDCDVVIEAVFERLELKRSVFVELDEVVSSPTALLLTNTSTLDVDEILRDVGEKRRGYCCGMHFFSPAHVMKLVEIVRGRDTSEGTIEAVRRLTRAVGKIGVVVGNCDGFVANRMGFPYTSESVLLLEEGGGRLRVKEVDDALAEFGMAMGPFVMSDLAGNDIGYFIRKAKGLVRDECTGRPGKNRPPTMRYSELGDDLVSKLGRVGQKAGKGWYDYDPKVGRGRVPLASEEVANFLAKASSTTSSSRPACSSSEVVERVLFPLVNEGFKILEEGIARDPADIDVIYIYGYGWPRWRGGPMYWADNEVGLPTLLAKLEGFHATYPGSEYYRPSELLKKCVSLGVGIQEYYRKKLHICPPASMSTESRSRL